MVDPVGTHAVNVTGTLNVLRAAQVNGVSRLINSSSSSVYGEQYAGLFAGLFGMTAVSLRYFNVYGPGQPSEGAYSLVIPGSCGCGGKTIP